MGIRWDSGMNEGLGCAVAVLIDGREFEDFYEIEVGERSEYGGGGSFGEAES
jgi:hypothetical protein